MREEFQSLISGPWGRTMDTQSRFKALTSDLLNALQVDDLNT